MQPAELDTVRSCDNPRPAQLRGTIGRTFLQTTKGNNLHDTHAAFAHLEMDLSLKMDD